MSNKKYFWLRLHRDFFKRHDIRVIEDMDNGKEYILFYLKILVESIDYEGFLRFSETIPYNEKMLSTITNTNIDIVRSAIKVFSELQMMEILDDGTIYLDQVSRLIGSEGASAQRVRRFRQKNKLDENNIKALHGNTEVTKCNTEKEIDKELEIEIEYNTLENFEILWKKYPNKDGKKQAWKHFKASVKTRNDLDDIHIALVHYQCHLQNNTWKRPKNGSTWFNNWKDWVNWEEPGKKTDATTRRENLAEGLGAVNYD